MMEYIHGLINGIFAEASVVLLLLGFILSVLGLLVLILWGYIRLTAHRIAGTVVGAVKDVRIKEKERKGKLETKVRENYFAVYEYVRPDGTLRQEKSSEGGDDVLKYATGQKVNLLVVPHEDFDDVYDADKNTALILAVVLLLPGLALMATASKLLISLSISGMSLLVILLFLLIKIALEKGRGKKNSKKNPRSKQHIKYFDPSDVKPIEEFLR